MTYSTGMSFVRQDLIGPGLATFLLVFMCYIAGRVHQFFKQTSEREEAYREGYNQATRALFSLATRMARPTVPKALPAPKPQVGYASVPNETRAPLPARHRAPGRRKPNVADTERFALWDADQIAAAVK